MSSWFPNAKFHIGLWISIFLGVVLFLEWFGPIDAQYRRVVWAVCLSLAVTPLMGFAIFPPNHVVLLPSLILIIMLVWERWRRQRIWFTLLILGIPIIGSGGVWSKENADALVSVGALAVQVDAALWNPASTFLVPTP